MDFTLYCLFVQKPVHRPSSSRAGQRLPREMDAPKTTDSAELLPPEVAWGIAVAAGVCDRLEATGRRVHFDTAGGDGLAIELHDLSGRVVDRISSTDALLLADSARASAF
jgi:hypothetical protein